MKEIMVTVHRDRSCRGVNSEGGFKGKGTTLAAVGLLRKALPLKSFLGKFSPRAQAWERHPRKAVQSRQRSAASPSLSQAFLPVNSPAGTGRVGLGAWPQCVEQGAGRHLSLSSRPWSNPGQARGVMHEANPPLSVDEQEVGVHPSCPGQRHLHPRMADPFPGSDSGRLSQRVTQTTEAAGPGHRSSPDHRQAWQSRPRAPSCR